VATSTHCTPVEAGQKAYAEALYKYHPWAIRQAVSIGLRTLPTRDGLLTTLGESEKSLEELGPTLVRICMTIRESILKVFVDLALGTEW